MVTPNNFFAKVGDIETDLTHAIYVRESVPPIVNLFYGCVPVIVEVRLKISFALVGHTVNSFLPVSYTHLTLPTIYSV